MTYQNLIKTLGKDLDKVIEICNYTSSPEFVWNKINDFYREQTKDLTYGLAIAAIVSWIPAFLLHIPLMAIIFYAIAIFILSLWIIDETGLQMDMKRNDIGIDAKYIAYILSKRFHFKIWNICNLVLVIIAILLKVL